MLTGLPPHSASFIACSEVWHGKERLVDPYPQPVNKQLILFQTKSASATEPANVVGNFYMVSFQF